MSRPRILIRALASGLLLALSAAGPVLADSIPPHLAAMAARLYAETRDSLESQTLAPDHRVAAEQTLEALRAVRLRYFSQDDVSIPDTLGPLAKALDLDASTPSGLSQIADLLAKSEADARTALGERMSGEQLNRALVALNEARSGNGTLATRHVIRTDDDQTVAFEWRPDSGKFLIITEDEGKERGIGHGEPFRTVLSGDTTLTPNAGTGALDLSMTPSDEPVRVLTQKDFDRIKRSIFATWVDADDSKWTFSPAGDNQDAGNIRRSPEEIRREIEAREDRVRAIENAKEFIWFDPTTEEILRQTRFSRLDEPWQYRGEDYATPDAKAEVSRLKEEIAALEKEAAGTDLPAVERDDPVGYGDSVSSGAAPIVIVNERAKGGTFTYTQATFDGRTVRGRGVHTELATLNDELPLWVRQDLLRSWNPPGWVELRAEVDSATGELRLTGEDWSLHVVYTTMFDKEVKEIRSPYSTPVRLSLPGSISRMAYGAADTATP